MNKLYNKRTLLVILLLTCGAYVHGCRERDPYVPDIFVDPNNFGRLPLDARVSEPMDVPSDTPTLSDQPDARVEGGMIDAAGDATVDAAVDATVDGRVLDAADVVSDVAEVGLVDRTELDVPDGE